MTEFHVYKAINDVTAALSKEGIAKTGRNTQGNGYNFRGIDHVLNALSSHLVEAKLVIVPRVVSREQVERISKNGGALFYTSIEVEFDLISAVDGSKHTARTFGEAMDSGDKSTNKAMSTAYKYMALQTFCIPTEPGEDTDNYTHEVESKKDKEQPQKPITSAEQKRQLLEIDKDLLDAHSEADVKRLYSIWASIAERDGWSKDYWDEAKKRFKDKRDDIKARDDEGFPGDTDIRDQSGRRMNALGSG